MLTTAEIIKKYNFVTKKKLGQNFLLRTSLLERIVDSAGDIASHDILEIGPGLGGLTMAILQRNPRRLISVELDAKLAEIINLEIKPLFNNLEILNANALLVDENVLFDSRFKIIANLPYGIGTTLLMKWLKNCPEKIEKMTLLVQREVANRIVATPGTREYGQLSVICQYLGKVKKCFDISPGEFLPSPKVTSSLVSLVPYDNLDPQKSLKFIELANILFRKKRKTILNNMIDSVVNARDILADCQISPGARSEELETKDFVKILEYIQVHNIIPKFFP
ncbi:MAG: 16S rRNA (adenine(1518)-N(6)/adenine(1519)-N(6))-dimethyltransferase RsmA [Rickettsiales bacterium]|jgi:16S rRNA (adenine1518-N6/adenine1519-N6)-dimethyltransferase|nr:16S rRNA (adenine(1518)-N(6)/adenine(1519)-N(6))-dimethyltransferase RsmA [Rickettsiales bacterium]